MPEDALEVIRLRNDFYRHNYRQLLTTVVLSVFIVLALISTLIYMVTHPPAPRYFAVSEDGQMVALVPLSEPNLSNAALLQWATKAASEAFHYNFVDYREAMQGIRDEFTDSGWRSFVQALEGSNNLSTVIAKKLVVSAVPTGTPVILEQGLFEGNYSWRIQLPLLISYQSASEHIPQPVLVTLLVTRVSTLQSARGIGIQQFIVSGSGSIRG